MFRIVLIIFIFFKSNVYAEDIKCNFEEIYNDGSIQEGYILLKNDKLRYQYQDEKLFTIFFDSNNFYSVNNSNKSTINKITENVEILEEIILLAKNYPNIKSEYNKEEFPNDLKKAGFEVTNVVPPKSGPLSKSGSLDTYYAKDEQGNEIAIVLGQGAGGIGSKGIAFEKQLEQDLINYTKGVTEFTHTELIESIIKEFDLKPDNFEVIPEGGMNKPRPLKFS